MPTSAASTPGALPTSMAKELPNSSFGNAIKDYEILRSNLVLLTKCYFGVDFEIVEMGQTDVTMSMMNDGHMVNCEEYFDTVDARVARLGTYIDVLQIHRLDHDTPPEEIMRALNDVVESGRV